MNGPLHGVARSVAKTPVRNAPSGPSFLEVSTEPAKPGTGISKTPRRLNPMAKTTLAIARLNSADWNKFPHPIFANAARLARIMKTARTPAEYARFKSNI